MQHFSEKLIQISSFEEYEKKKKLFKTEFLQSLSNNSRINFRKKTSNLFRGQKTSGKKINVHQFNKVLQIDLKEKTATVEAMIRFEDLVAETLKYDLLPPVVPQLKTITLGGAISGVGIEASSFKYGLVHETVLKMEVMLASGQIITCTPTNKYKDLFFGLPNSYGTLGYILKIKIPLVPAKKYVQISYHKYSNSSNFFSSIEKCCQDKTNDFVEGVIFNEREMYISIGKFTDAAPQTSNYRFLNIYFQSIKKRRQDYLNTVDFIWRWDTDWFWCSKVFYMQNPIWRFLFGKFVLGSKSYWKIARLEEKYKIRQKIEKILFGKVVPIESVVQDICIPIENCQKFLDFFQKEIKIKPIWICPFSVGAKKYQYSLFELDHNKFYLDFGFWDTIKLEKGAGYYNKKIEKITEELGGKKTLYSEAFYTNKKFWQLYNGKTYHKLKQKYDLKNTFLDLYQKCVLNK